MTKKVLFGAVYIIEQERPKQEIIRDFDNMREMGFNLVTLWPVSNSWLAERPDEFVFDDTQWVLDICAERGIKVILQLIGQNPSQEYMPDCLLQPEMLTPEIRNCFWANPNHPDVDRCIHEFISQAINALKDHPAVYAWDVFNEAHLNTEDSWTIGLFRQWLKDKYGTIADLNHRWYRRYGNFEQVNPADRNAPDSLWSSLLPAVDFEKFCSENLTDICRRWVKYARQADSEHPVIVDCVAGLLLSESIVGQNNNDFGIAGTCDIFGGTFYPKSWRQRFVHGWRLPLCYALSAGAAHKAGKPFHINELQTHTQSALTPGSEVSPNELSGWIWSGLASGARGIQLWRWRPFLHGFQATGRGLTAIDGTPGPRAEAVKTLATVLMRHEPLFAEAGPVNPAVKLVVSYRSRLFYDKLRFNWPDSGHAAAIEGWFRIFWASGIPVSVTDLDCLDNEDMNTPLLVLPSLISYSDADSEKLENYVKNGGLLIADARLGAIDEYGVVRPDGIPGKVLSKVFGFTETDVAGPVEFNFCKEKVIGSFLSQKLDIAADVNVLGSTDKGEPVAVEHQYGQGRSLYFAAFMGRTWREKTTDSQKRFFREFVLNTAPRTPWAEKSDNVTVSFHHNKDWYLVYVINMADTEEYICLHNVPAENHVTELVTSSGLPGGQVISLKVPARQTRVLAWQKAKREKHIGKAQ